MNLLINEPPLQVLPSLAKKIGLNEAIFLQQLHFRLLISKNERDGHKWMYNSYSDWHKEFPFWSEKTIKRVIRRLEDEGYIISTDEYNKLKMDKTKWYRLNYSKIRYTPLVQNGTSIGTNCPHALGHNEPTEEDKLSPPIPKNNKSNKNSIVEQLDNVRSVIDYLNTKANKQYRATTAATKRVIQARLNEGFVLEDFQRVIDVKCKDWLNNPDMNKYLRPETLFGNKFEAYLNEAPGQKQSVFVQPSYQPPILDFRAGEE